MLTLWNTAAAVVIQNNTKLKSTIETTLEKCCLKLVNDMKIYKIWSWHVMEITTRSPLILLIPPSIDFLSHNQWFVNFVENMLILHTVQKWRHLLCYSGTQFPYIHRYFEKRTLAQSQERDPPLRSPITSWVVRYTVVSTHPRESGEHIHLFALF